MKKDIFADECRNPLIIGLVAVVILANFLPDNIRQIFNVLFFFILGGLCLYNFNRCGREHCQFTGIGFVGVGIIALLNLLDVINISEIIIWLIFFIVLVLGYGFEFFYKGKTGSCYRKKK